jgi:hypothetical protein
MPPWEICELYPPLDIKDILGYPNNLPPKWENNILKLDDDALCVILHVSSFFKYVSKLNEGHEDVLIRLFVIFLEEYQWMWVKDLTGLMKITSLVGVIQVFLKCCFSRV